MVALVIIKSTFCLVEHDMASPIVIEINEVERIFFIRIVSCDCVGKAKVGKYYMAAICVDKKIFAISNFSCSLQ